MHATTHHNAVQGDIGAVHTSSNSALIERVPPQPTERAPISLAPIGLLLGFWVAFGAVAELVDRSKLGRIPVRESARRLIGLPRSAWSTAIAHFGMGVTVLGIVATSAWETELVTTLNEGETAVLSGYSIAFDDFD